MKKSGLLLFFGLIVILLPVRITHAQTSTKTQGASSFLMRTLAVNPQTPDDEYIVATPNDVVIPAVKSVVQVHKASQTAKSHSINDSYKVERLATNATEPSAVVESKAHVNASGETVYPSDEAVAVALEKKAVNERVNQMVVTTDENAASESVVRFDDDRHGVLRQINFFALHNNKHSVWLSVITSWVIVALFAWLGAYIFIYRRQLRKIQAMLNKSIDEKIAS
ncbi:MAG: hypothetical protein LBT80_06485 [Lactobacillaceae bacterium]|jgi:hypothetical protein|nr:hypothetical protein [Lactobacillaceae bacterium]